ncbi:MAG: lipoprotein transporter, permease component [Pseudonocardiales bacterium]|nr:lipoprotein transporter, permease component [Pseudonocardiales bacterium]
MTASLAGTRTPGAAMRRVSVRNLRAHKVRLLLTVLSVVLGTAFVAGSFVFTDTLRHTFNNLFADVAKGVDVQITASDDRSSGVPLSDIQKIQSVAGVSRVQTQVQSQIVLIGSNNKAVQGGGAPSFGYAYTPPAEQLGDPERFIAGRPPTAAGEIALNKGALELAKLKLDDTTRIVVPSAGIIDVKIVGVYNTDSDTGGFVGALLARSQALSLFTDGEHVNTVNVAGDGVSQIELRDRIAAALPNTFDVKTGEQVQKDTQSDVDTALSFVNYFLLAFGVVALLVGTFIIYNTFSMIVAQRLRELALLRAIGASPRQVSRSVLLEAVLVGLVGSLVGIAGGIGLAYGLRALLNSFNFGLPSGPLQVEPRTIIVGLLVGIIVTVVSAYSPARRAAKTPPVEAMRQEFASTGTSLRRRTIIGSVLGAIGVAALVAGGLAKAGAGAAGLVGIGALALIFAVLIGGASLARPVVGGLGLGVRPFGAVGRLSRTNATRNPRRTAATAFALTLGLLLVSAIAVFGASTKQSINALVDNGITADYILNNSSQIGLPVEVGQEAAKVDGVNTAVALHGLPVKIGGSNQIGTGIDGDFGQVFTYKVIDGRADITGNNIVISQTTAKDRDWKVGSPAPMTTVDGASIVPNVAGIYKDNQLLGSFLAGTQLYESAVPAKLRTDFVVLVKGKPGVDQNALRGDLERATDKYLVIQVENRTEFKGSVAKQIDSLLGLLYGLLGLAIVIAVLGIINTLALSVVERRREIGMLRAVGMRRGQVRRTIYLESALIALFGAIVGVVLGLTFGALFVRTLREQGLDQISVPWGQAVLFLAISAVVGVLAALWPAVRAARTPPLAAISEG